VATKHDRKKVGEIITKVRELGLSYKEGAKKFGIKPWLLYDYNRKANRDAREPSGAGTVQAAAAETPKENEARPLGLPGDVGELILSYRKEHPSHGFKWMLAICSSRSTWSSSRAGRADSSSLLPVGAG
jgi:hypothetical protein